VVTVNKPKPQGKCYGCGGSEWWWNKLANAWQCPKCLPNDIDSNYVEPDYPGKGQVSASGPAPVQKVAKINVCPKCGAFSATSDGRTIKCTKCGNEGPGVRWPDPPGEAEVVNLEVDKVPAIAPEVEALRVRVAAGNARLISAILEIRKITDTEEHINGMREWGKAVDKLRALSEQLEAMGYRDCLYLENGKRTHDCLDWPEGIACFVCPSGVNYAEKELFSLNSPRARRDAVGAAPELIEFLNKLGEEV